jgi:Flp pilus assembly protein TadD
METALAHSGENYNVTVTINNALGALGKKDALQNFLHRQIAILESHIRKVPEDARARVLMAAGLSQIGRYEEAKREADIAVALRPDDTMVLYNVACVLCLANKPDEAMVALRKSKETGNRSAAWVRQDPDLAILRGRPDFEELYPGENA